MFSEPSKIKTKSDFIWAFRYAPKKISDLILLDKHLPRFKKIIETKHLPDTLLYGPAGTGKSSACNVLINEIGFDVLHLNGSLENSVDNIRNDVKNFTMRSSQFPKLVYIEEFDHLSSSAMAGLRAEMEACQKTHFLFNCNYVDKIIEPIKSRCGGGISFFYSNEEKKELQKKYFLRCQEILDKENVKYDPKAVAKIVQNKFPDMRNIIHNMQEVYQQFEEISLKSVDSIIGTDLGKFFELIKSKDFNKIRSWIANYNQDYSMIYSAIVGKIENYVEKDSIAKVIDLCYDHQKATIGNPDPQLPLVHFCVSLFMGANLK